MIRYCVYWNDIGGRGKKEFKTEASAIDFAFKISRKGAINIIIKKKED